MRIPFLPVAALLALAIPGSALAQQTTDAPDDNSITVTGRSPVDEAEARRIVNRVSRPVDGQLARFYDPVCPMVTGLPEPYASKVVDRIKAVAKSVGARVGKPGCSQNFYVVIVADGRDFTAELHRRWPGEFFGVAADEVRRLTEQEGATRSWSVTMMRNEDGQAAADVGAKRGGGAGDEGGININGNVKVLRVTGASIINPPTQQSIQAAYVVIDTRATLGKQLTQIADYAAMRGLAITTPAALEGGEPTILRLFDADATGAPARLTAMDEAYLTGLYRGSAARAARVKAREMAKRMADRAPKADD